MNITEMIYRWLGLKVNPMTTDTNLTENDNGTTIVAKVGDKVNVVLAWKPSSGYLWQENETSAAVMEEIKHEGEDTKPGAVIYVHMRFRVIGPGVIRLSYARPWSETAPPVQWFEVKVTIQ